ncbi:MAG: serine/threonine protein kinase psk1 [Lichina confinis]|nr:MAG: serine/threonine protein kinase psk1 [Lichina confinis]
MDIFEPHFEMGESTGSPVDWAPNGHSAPTSSKRDGFSSEMKARTAEPTPTLAPVPRPFSPVLAGADDSDFSNASTPKTFVTRLKDLPSAGASPLMRPSSACSQGGITAMRLQLESLSIKSGPGKVGLGPRQKHHGVSTPGRGGDAGSEPVSEGERTPMVTYEIPLDEDFISTEADASVAVEETYETEPAGRDEINRKMSAADFEPLRCLGKGTFGTVILVRHIATGRLYAQKQFRKASLTVHKKLIEQTKTERTILESVNSHPFVVKLYYAFQDHEKLYLILEYAQGGELFTHLVVERMFSEDVAAFYMAEVILALEHLHRNVGIVYRDLKPENVLLDSDGHVLLTDFGLSKVAVDGGDPDRRCRSILGTVEYMAPEVVQGKSYGTAVDWWSLGALGFDLMTGSPPFRGGNHAKIQEKIVKQKLALPYYLSPDAKDLLTRLLRKDPRKRLGRDLAALKKHRFFRKIDWVKLERRDVRPPICPLITDPSLAENFSPDFTNLALSPVNSYFDPADLVFDKLGGGQQHASGAATDSTSNPFGGFSFVASSSLLEQGTWGF